VACLIYKECIQHAVIQAVMCKTPRLINVQKVQNIHIGTVEPNINFSKVCL